MATKRSRRGHGEGSIYQRKDGRWAASFLVEETGKRKYLYGETRKEAYDKLQQALQEQKQGILTTGPHQKLKDYLEHWFEKVHKQEVRQTSYLQQRYTLYKHLIPALGHIQLHRLTPQQENNFYTARAEEGLAPASIRGIHAILHNALKNAVRWNLVSYNVCDRVKLPRLGEYQPQVLTKEQAILLLQAIKGHPLEAFFVLALTTGMRHGELLGLKWSDIDFETRKLSVRRTVSHITGHGFIEGEPKTKKSRRIIMLPRLVVTILQEHLLRQQAVRFKADGVWEENDLVFCTQSGKFLSPNHTREALNRLLTQIGFPHMRMHDLRHSASSLLILEMKTSPKLVQELLGHSQIQMTMDRYTHSDPEMHLRMMDDLDDFFQE